MALTVFYTPRWRAIDANGNPMNGAILKFFEAGTSTPLPVYADVDGTTPLGVTVTADAGGLFPEIFMLAQAYKVELYTSANVLVWSADDFFPPQPASASSVSLLAVAGVSFTAGQAGYLSDGSGALSAGQMYLTDADLEYASATPMVYFAVSAVTAGQTGLFISEGAVTGLSGLTPGALYYLSDTAGAISTSAGTFTRLVGQARTTTELAIATNPPMPLVSSVVNPLIKSLCNGRLTLTSGVPVPPSPVSAATTVYWTPYSGNAVALYSGTVWEVFTLSELSIAVPATTNTAYDVFLDYNSGTPQLVVLAWANLTTRATALTTQDGVLVKTGATTQRYLGSFRTTGVSGQTESSLTKRYLWNYYNRVPQDLLVSDANASWTYTTATIRQANGAAGNQVEVMIGVQEAELDLTLQVTANNSSGVSFAVGIGEDSTSTFATGAGIFGGGNVKVAMTGRLAKKPAVGSHTYSWNEWSAAVGTTTWYGTSGDSTPANVESGLRGWIQG